METQDNQDHDEEMNTDEYTDSLIAFLQEKNREYLQRGVPPTLEHLINELQGSKQ